MEAKKLNLYQKYGGFDVYHKIIYDLYIELFDRPEISFHFLGVDPFWLSKQQATYLCQYLGGPECYDGSLIKEVHRGMKITAYEFDVVAKRFTQIFEERGFEQKDVEYIMQFIAGHKDLVVTANTNIYDQVMRPFYSVTRKIFSMLKSRLKLNL